MADLYTKDDVRVWGDLGGAVFWAPKGTALPEEWDEPLNAAFKPTGILSEDGVEEELSVDSNKIKGWPAGQTVRVTNTSTEKTIKFTPLQDTPLVAQLYYGTGAPTSDGGTGARIDIPEAVGLVEGSIVVVKVDGDTVKRRCCELVQVTERGSVTSNTEDAAGREITVESVGVDYELTNAAAYVAAIVP